MSKVFKSCGMFYKRGEDGKWLFYTPIADRWVLSLDANHPSPHYEQWLLDLRLIGNNFRLK